jgi:GMP synthase-like glutamine amidotransferase
MTKLTVIQHTSAEYLGLMEDHFEGRRIRFAYCRPFVEGTPIPHQDNVGDGLVLLGGGPWGSAGGPSGGRDVPTLKAEVELTEACLLLGLPVIGIGLGAQILALAAGGSSKAHALISKVGTARRLNDGALQGYLPGDYPLVTYMRDRPVPPEYAHILAVNEDDEPALFQIGDNCFGFSGHPGIKSAMLEDLVMEFEEAPENAAESLEAMRPLKTAIEDSLISIMTGVIQMTGLMKEDHITRNSK